jgi:Na+/melibiose symporter-like transporter
MIGYGFGQVGESLVSVGFNTFLLFYYNQVLGVSGTVTGFALGISLVLDAVVDPTAGALSDRVRSRLGRRHPFMLASAVPPRRRARRAQVRAGILAELSHRRARAGRGERTRS